MSRWLSGLKFVAYPVSLAHELSVSYWPREMKEYKVSEEFCFPLKNFQYKEADWLNIIGWYHLRERPCTYREWERSRKYKRGSFIDFLIWECIFLCASVQTLELSTETKRWVPRAEFLLLWLLWNSSMPNTDPKLDCIRQNWWGWPLQSLQS